MLCNKYRFQFQHLHKTILVTMERHGIEKSYTTLRLTLKYFKSSIHKEDIANRFSSFV